MAAAVIDRIEIEGYKSFKNQVVNLGPINVLIGANGSGKSNFLDFFKFVSYVSRGELLQFVGLYGGAENLIHFGKKVTDYLRFKVHFEDDLQYEFVANATRIDSLQMKGEAISSNPIGRPLRPTAGTEAKLSRDHSEVGLRIRERFNAIKKYHFHDTGDNSAFNTTSRSDGMVHTLAWDGSNLAAFLKSLRSNDSRAYSIITRTIQSVAPYFSDFEFSETETGFVTLLWRPKLSDSLFRITDFSDGTLRFVALCCLFLQPKLPEIILIDEPEIGLHPRAIAKLAGLVRSAAGRGSQVVLATQSTELINYSQPEEIVTVDQMNGETIMHRLSSEALKGWLEDYTMGDLWSQAIITEAQVHP